MFSLEYEITALEDDTVLDKATASRLIALERREVVSLYGELRVLTWAGVMLIAAGVGVIVTKNFDRIGPLTIALSIAMASGACYAYAEWRRRASHAAGFKASLLDDYILLLGALLLSADIGFIEHQWHLLGANWQRHFLVLAAVHGVTAYVFASRMLLSLSISALAAFLGIERRLETLFSETTDMAIRSFVCAAILFAWRIVDQRMRATVIPSRRSPEGAQRGEESPAQMPAASDQTGVFPDVTSRGTTATPFTPVFDHFATNLAFWGALILGGNVSTYLIGCPLAIAFALLALRYGLRQREELFVIYALVYGVVAVNLLVFHVMGEPILFSLFVIVSTTASIVMLFVIHMRMREARS